MLRETGGFRPRVGDVGWVDFAARGLDQRITHDASAPTVPQLAQTMRGPDVGTATSSNRRRGILLGGGSEGRFDLSSTSPLKGSQ
jgi:hypothetical protein